MTIEPRCAANTLDPYFYPPTISGGVATISCNSGSMGNVTRKCSEEKHPEWSVPVIICGILLYTIK